MPRANAGRHEHRRVIPEPPIFGSSRNLASARKCGRGINRRESAVALRVGHPFTSAEQLWPRRTLQSSAMAFLVAGRDAIQPQLHEMIAKLFAACWRRIALLSTAAR